MNWEIREYSQEFDKDGNRYEFRARRGLPLKTKLLIGGGLVGGIALGTILFLFFLTVFLYVFVPVAVILILSSFAQKFLKR